MNDRLPYDSFVIAPDAELPYSKGVMAKMLMVTGIPPSRAYSLAQQIERRLIERFAFFRHAIGCININAATRTERHRGGIASATRRDFSGNEIG